MVRSKAVFFVSQFLLISACLSVIAALSSGTDAIVSHFEAFPTVLEAVLYAEKPPAHVEPRTQEQKAHEPYSCVQGNLSRVHDLI